MMLFILKLTLAVAIAKHAHAATVAGIPTTGVDNGSAKSNRSACLYGKFGVLVELLA